MLRNRLKGNIVKATGVIDMHTFVNVRDNDTVPLYSLTVYTCQQHNAHVTTQQCNAHINCMCNIHKPKV